MAMRLSLGQYVSAQSPIHRLDPRAKVCVALTVMISVFFIHTPQQIAFGYALTLACVFASHILPLIEAGEYKSVLFLATGALLSPLSSLQGESIPAIAHAVVIEHI